MYMKHKGGGGCFPQTTMPNYSGSITKIESGYRVCPYTLNEFNNTELTLLMLNNVGQQ